MTGSWRGRRSLELVGAGRDHASAARRVRRLGRGGGLAPIKITTLEIFAVSESDLTAPQLSAGKRR